MLPATQIRVLLFVALMCLPVVAAAQRIPPTGQSTITGRVLFTDTNRPVRRAQVSLFFNLNHPAIRVTPANQLGEFRFTEVPAGSYFVVAASPGIVSLQSSFVMTEFGLGGSSADTEQTRVTVDGKNAIRCEVRVVRGGTIKGTITYTDKEPVVSARLVLFRRKGGTLTRFFIDDVLTNDRGMYRIDGLPEGEYFVSVMVGKSMAQETDFPGPGTSPSAYYPSVKSLAEAKPVQLQSGAEVAGINITVDDTSRRISGVLKWRDGEPVTGGGLTLRRKNEPSIDFSLSHMFRTITPPDTGVDNMMSRDLRLMMMAFPQSAEVSPDGRWEFEDLAPGTYIITAYTQLSDKKIAPKPGEDGATESSAPDSMSIDQRMVSRQVEITVDEEDRNDVTIEMTEGGRILGTVVMADGSLPPQIPIAVDQPSKPDFMTNLPYTSNADGTFEMEGISAGEVRIDVELFGRDDLYLKSITLGSQDLMREALRVNEGVEVTGVRIVLEKGMATLTGRVQWNEDAAPAGGAGVLLVKADRTLWQMHSSRWFAIADASGVFSLKCPPGDYLVFTWPMGGQPLEAIGEFLRAQSGAARTVSLQSKQEKQIELTVVRPKK